METFEELYCMAEAYAYGRLHSSNNDVISPSAFAQAYVDTWKVWQQNVTDENFHFMPPDEYYKTYSALSV